MIKIGFELEVDIADGVEAPSALTIVQALSEVLPKEWWADYREADWGVKALFALNDDGTLMQAHDQYRPTDLSKQVIFIRSQLAQERKLTQHQADRIEVLEKANGNQFDLLEGEKRSVKSLRLEVDGSLKEWTVMRDLRDDLLVERDGLLDTVKNDTMTVNRLREDLKVAQAMNRERLAETSVNEEMVAKIVDAMQGAGFDIAGGWGNDAELEELETASTQIADQLQATQKSMLSLSADVTNMETSLSDVSTSIDDASSEQDGLESLLDNIRTRR